MLHSKTCTSVMLHVQRSLLRKRRTTSDAELLKFEGCVGCGFRPGISYFRVQGLGFRVQGLGYRVWGLGFRVCTCRAVNLVQGSGFRVQGLGSAPAGR